MASVAVAGGVAIGGGTAFWAALAGITDTPLPPYGAPTDFLLVGMAISLVLVVGGLVIMPPGDQLDTEWGVANEQ